MTPPADRSIVTNRAALADTPAADLALDCLEAGIAAAHPERVTARAVELADGRLRVAGVSGDPAAYDLADYDRVLVLGGGKAAATVAVELEAIVGDRLDGGLVVTTDPRPTDRVAVREAAHPVPDAAGEAAARDLLDRAAAAGDDTLVIGVVTGGASALLPAPAGDLALADLRETTAALLASGTDIDAINAVRKHLSALKGGRLAAAAAPATVVVLALSDVVGDDPNVIGSGPFAPDPTTYRDALDALAAAGADVPAAVRERLERGAAGDRPETPGPDHPALGRVRTAVIGTSLTACRAARDRAADAGFRTVLLSSRVRGEAREAARTAVAVAEESRASGDPVAPPAVVVSGGETTVTVNDARAGDPAAGSGDGDGRPDTADRADSTDRTDRSGPGGRGGPNQEFAVAAGVELTDPGTVVAAVDTDGIDGPTDVAGGLVDAGTLDRDEARAALAAHDVTRLLSDAGAAIRTGPTGTNVNDLRVTVVPAWDGGTGPD